ncbi:hypothetical protein Rt10032_c01g0530 [Rhodotorula toruloides]|uniref:Uncharacterized protein n=1 Tax=Rhodotorula toruloides TaxID=5286 RepID=A0A511K837_RHOTO|nr:hypothetical protein Rt10032_c01g0530 [Rhodotorula toruloides]
MPGGGVASGDERFVLIGTQTGLYLLDNRPTSASIPLSTSSSSAEAQILPLWTGLSIRRLEVYAEPAIGTDSPQGLVLGLVEEDGVPGLRMWTLACIVNLVKWRVYDQNSIALPLGSRASKSSADRHSSSLTYAKSFVGSTSPKCRKGKGLASPLQPPPHTHRDSAKPGYLFVDTNVHFDTGADSPTASLRSLNRLSLADSPSISQPPPLSEAERLATPLDWARSSVPLPLSTGSGDILFFQLSRSPEPAPSTDEGDSSDSSDSYEDEPAASRRYRTAQDERDKLFLFVVTSKSIFLYESRPSGRRSWTLTKEYFAPSAPRFLRLVRTIGQTPLAPTASPSLASTLYSPDLALLVGLAHHSVLIRLCDSSVTELSLPPSSLPHSGAAGSRSRSSSNTSLASLSPTHRRTSSIVPLLQELKDHPVVAKVARFVEGEKGVPAGMRGTDGPIPKGKRAKDDEGGLASIASLSAGKWVGCEEIRVDNGRRPKRRFFLFTKGTTTYLVASPLYLTPPVSPIAAHSAPHLTPLHTFHWPTLGTSPSSSLTHLSAFIAPLENGSSFSHLILVGFSSTGLSIQEHLVSHAGVEAVFASPSATVPQDSTKRIVVPLDSASVPTGNEEDDPDLSNSATLDFGRETGWLCATRDDGCAEHSASDARGGYVWTRAQGEYVVKRVGVKV